MDVTGEELRTVIGANVRDQRRIVGLTQRQLATTVGVTDAQISRIEAGKSSPSVELLALLADTLDTTPSTLLSKRKLEAVG